MRAIILLLMFTGSVFAEEVTIPVVGRPSPFYGAAGRGVTITASVEPATFTRHESCTLTLRISKLSNPAAVQRPDLGELNSFRNNFQVKPLPDGTTLRDDERVFRYELRPRRPDITEVPEIAFPYFNPSVVTDNPKQSFQVTRSEALPVTITKPAEPPAIPSPPLEIPAFAESLTDAHEPWATPGLTWRVLAPLTLMFVMLAGWLRWRDEDGEGFRRRQHQRMTRRTIRRLERSGLALDGLVRIMKEYHDGCPANDASASDEWPEFLARVDEFRFAPPATRSLDELRLAALELVRHREGEG